MLLTDDTTIYDDDPDDMVYCLYCGEPTSEGATLYCSALCACYAARDNAEDRS